MTATNLFCEGIAPLCDVYGMYEYFEIFGPKDFFLRCKNRQKHIGVVSPRDHYLLCVLLPMRISLAGPTRPHLHRLRLYPHLLRLNRSGFLRAAVAQAHGRDRVAATS